jgi:hypothetical protein
MKVRHVNNRGTSPSFKDLRVGDVFTLDSNDGILFMKMPLVSVHDDGGADPLDSNAFCFEDNELHWVDEDEIVYMRRAEIVVEF